MAAGGAPCDRSVSTCMGFEREASLLVRFAVPVIAGFLITRFYVLVDGVFVGQMLSDVGMAAITTCFPFVTLLNAFIMLIGDGGAAAYALRLGARDREGAARVLGTTIFLMVAAGIGVSVIGSLFAVPILELFGARGSVLQAATPYLVVTCWGAVFLGFSLGVDAFLRTAGFPMRTLAVQVLCAGVNIVLDYFAIMVMGWGVLGAALATLVAQGSGCALTIVFCIAPTCQRNFASPI